ncbi:MAG: DUF488 domain-containing protein [Proteobacteria bacterium]|jgi:uncharacterized protein (DUF488 family)|nr:DUF488 domain-containing protein [Pseudomonadota bacterium]
MSDSEKKPLRRPRVFTLGHGAMGIDDLLLVLERSAIRLIADVRTNPAAARLPWFERHALASELERHGLAYRWFRDLGGWRSAVGGEAQHTALSDESERRYAAAMNTVEFEVRCTEITGLAASTNAAILCAEVDPDHCHRRLLADKLFLMGVRVVHILGRDEARDHTLHPDLVVENGAIIYRDRQLKLV